MSSALLQPEERVLSTLNADGSRRWLKPRVAQGRFLRARRAVGWLLIAVFTAMPHLRLDGRPLFLLDIVRRDFTLFGRTFLPTDTLLLALLLVSVFITVFLLTALLGRVWCGWGCPQTVYMEFVYRPIERLFDGAPGRPKPTRFPALRKVGKYAAFVLVSMFLAHTFLAYFVGTDALRQWVTQSPLKHPVPFLVMVSVTAAMLFDFGFFREQLCIVACPYGRMQSVMLDAHSLIVSYDRERGEPRGKARRGTTIAEAGQALALPVLQPAPVGDCVDCSLCVQVCPTGIDIRNGLQMECIGCAQCIDACAGVMRKLNRPTELIRYSSQAAMAHKGRRLLRPRVIVYPLVLVAALSLLIWRLQASPAADVSLLRGKGLPFNVLPDGLVSNQLKLRVVNRTASAASYELTLSDADAAAGVRLTLEKNPITVAPNQFGEEPVIVTLPRGAFTGGKREITIDICDGAAFSQRLTFKLLGPGGNGTEVAP